MKLSAGQSLTLDFMRAAASLFVLIGHAWALTKSPTANYAEIQTLGVVIFFVMSGFLITYTCIIRNNYSFPEYFIDRFARIFTSLLPALLMVVFIDWIGRQNISNDNYSIKTFLANALMIQFNPGLDWFFGISMIPRLGTNTPLWSIPIEWWLYMLFGVLYLPSGGRLGLALKLALAPIAIATFSYSTGHSTIGIAWIIGAAFALTFHFAIRIDLFVAMGMSIVAAIIILTQISINGADSHRIDWKTPNMIVGVSLAIFTLLIAAEKVRLSPIIKSTIEFLALLSYPLYLIHMPIQRAIYSYVSPGSFAVFAATILAPLVAVIGFSYAFEIHHKRVRRRIKSAAERLGILSAGARPGNEKKAAPAA